METVEHVEEAYRFQVSDLELKFTFIIKIGKVKRETQLILPSVRPKLETSISNIQ